MGRLPALLVLVALLAGVALGTRFAEGDGASTAATPPPALGEAPPTAPAASSPPGPQRSTTTATPQTTRAPAPAPAPAAVRRSRAIGHPWRGRLAGGVQLAAQSTNHFTWDWGRDVSPNASWRRWGTDVLVEWVQAVVAGYRAANPGAPRVGIADLSRPTGGDFGPEVAGGLGHASHQNGLDVDVLYPRTDRRELAPLRAAQVDRRLAQALVDAFVRAGAEKAFVGHGVGLKGPKGVVVRLGHHDDHVHVRISKRALRLWRGPLGLR